ncbi:hypothetical protein VNI00_005080 [Paramarasmius palmivorus]|uniref:Uncharacterized protein n=1 Tax=Paramarasmius palmivorus TaxID=297713 RepID=A0AAW0DHS0_9AGAR
MRGVDNLQEYLCTAQIPEMKLDYDAPFPPPPGHKSHLNDLAVRSESWRRLECIYTLNDYGISRVISSWVREYIPNEPLENLEDRDPISGERLAVPCPTAAKFEIPFIAERRPKDIHRIINWLDNFPLMTVQRTIHLLQPDLRHWEFRLCSEASSARDREHFQHFLWSLPSEILETLQQPGLAQAQRKSVVVALQPPWVLSPQDIKQFASCQSFPQHRLPGHMFTINPLKSEERLWAKLWDLCVTQGTPWFVLTSYNQWVFGMFSEGWTNALVTGVYEWNSSSPTIIECLTFWLASAMGIATNLQYPKVPEPANLPPPQVIQCHDADIPNPAISESEWVGKDSDAATSAHVEAFRPESPPLSERGLMDDILAPVYRDNRQVGIQLVRDWMEAMRTGRYNSFDSPTSPASNVIRPIIGATREDNIQFVGQWLDVAASCIFLATKTEECGRKLQDVAKVYHSKVSGADVTQIAEKSPEVDQYQSNILLTEEYLLEAICFDFTVESPHAELVELYRLGRDDYHLQDYAWSLAHDSYRTPICLFYPPHITATACYVLAQRLVDGPNSPSLDARISFAAPSASLPTPPSHKAASPDESRLAIEHFALTEDELRNVSEVLCILLEFYAIQDINNHPYLSTIASIPPPTVPGWESLYMAPNVTASGPSASSNSEDLSGRTPSSTHGGSTPATSQPAPPLS